MLKMHERHWFEMKSMLQQLERECTEDNLMRVLLHDRDPVKLPNLHKALAHFGPAFIPDILTKVTRLALELETLFPIPLLNREHSTVVLNKRQVYSLLANMFLGTVRPSSVTDDGLYRTRNSQQPIGQTSWLTFWPWMAENDGKHSLGYLQSLLRYFSGEDTISTTGVVSFELHCANEEDKCWQRSTTAIASCGLQVVTGGKMGDDGDFEGAVVSFSNRRIGFGCGGTQEEDLLATFPEACLVALLMGNPLEEEECVAIRGCFSTITRRSSTILAMDALMFSGLPGENRLEQLQEENLLRELRKAHCGFSVATGDVETGFWGCGAFGGDPELKALLQLMAAAEAGTKIMIFRVQENHEFADSFRGLYSALKANGVSVATCLKYLSDLRVSLCEKKWTFRTLSDETPFLFQYILKRIASSCP